jgi:hypothetical protein
MHHYAGAAQALSEPSRKEEAQISIPFVLAAFVASGPAAAQSWEEYDYPKYAFAVVFPAKPQVDETTFQVADNRLVPAQVYSVRQRDVIFKMTVAELAGTNLEESAIIDHAIKTNGEAQYSCPHLPGLRSAAYGQGSGQQPVNGPIVRLQGPILSDRGEGASWPERQRSPRRRGSFSSIADLHR